MQVIMQAPDQPGERLSAAQALTIILEAWRSVYTTIYWEQSSGRLAVNRNNKITTFTPSVSYPNLVGKFMGLGILAEANDVPRVREGIRKLLADNFIDIQRLDWQPASYRQFVDNNDLAWLAALFAGHYLTQGEIRDLRADVVIEAAISQIRYDYEGESHLNFNDALRELSTC